MDADVDTPLVVRTLRCRHPWLSGGLDAWDALERRPKGVADAVVAVGHPLPPAPAVESMQGVLGERRAGPLVGLVTLRPGGAPRAAVAHAVAMP